MGTSPTETALKLKVMAFFLVALGSVIEILEDHLEVLAGYKWLKGAGLVVAGLGIVVWMCSKRAKSLGDAGKEGVERGQS